MINSKNPQHGDIVIYNNSKSVYGHVGIIQEIKNDFFVIDSNLQGKKRIDVRPFSKEIGVIGFYNYKK